MTVSLDLSSDLLSANLSLNVGTGGTDANNGNDGAPPYELIVGELPENYFRVHAFDGEEILSHAYHFDVTVTATPNGDIVQEDNLRKPARFIWHIGKSPRAFYGVIASVKVEPLGDVQPTFKYHLRFVPRLWLLTRITRSRIYQNQRVTDVVTSVLLEMGISVRWQVLRQYPIREYITQYEESNYAFVQRLLAEAGISFYFAQGGPMDPAAFSAASAISAVGSLASSAVGSLASSAMGSLAGSALGSVVSDVASAAQPLIPGDTVIGCDDATFYPSLGPDDAGALAVEGAAALVPEAAQAVGSALGGLGGAASSVVGAASAVAGAVVGALAGSSAPTLYYVRGLNTTRSHQDRVMRFSLRNTVESNSANVRYFDETRPGTRLNSASVSSAPFPPSPVETAAMAATTASTAVSALAPGPLGGSVSAVVGAAEAVVNTISAATGAPGSLLETYRHDNPFLFPKWPVAFDKAPLLLRQERREASVAEGESGCSDLAPAHRFALSDHPVPELDRAYAVTQVDHRGQTYPQPGTE